MESSIFLGISRGQINAPCEPSLAHRVIRQDRDRQSTLHFRGLQSSSPERLRGAPTKASQLRAVPRGRAGCGSGGRQAFPSHRVRGAPAEGPPQGGERRRVPAGKGRDPGGSRGAGSGGSRGHPPGRGSARPPPQPPPPQGPPRGRAAAGGRRR